MKEVFEAAETKMNKTVNALINEYAAIRAGRANPAILDKIAVDYYGVPTPVNQMAAVSVPTPAPFSSPRGTNPPSRPSKRPSRPPTSASTLRTTAPACA